MRLDILTDAIAILEERGQQYGDITPSFNRAAVMATAMLDKTITPRDVAMVLLAVKMSRLANDPSHRDSVVDGINYLVIASSLPSNATKDGQHK